MKHTDPGRKDEGAMPVRREHDYYGWCLEQHTLLAARDTANLDYDHLAEELYRAAMRDLDALTTHLQMLLAHLLKLHLGREHRPHDVARAGRGWWLTVRAHRVRVQGTLVRSRTLRTELPQVVAVSRVRKSATASGKAMATSKMAIHTSSGPIWRRRSLLSASAQQCSGFTNANRPKAI
jgi:uncharacterized protein DUF29